MKGTLQGQERKEALPFLQQGGKGEGLGAWGLLPDTALAAVQDFPKH